MAATHNGRAALLDVQSVSWRLTAAVPFKEPLYNPVAVWTGNTYLVVGNRCGASRDDGGALPVCQPGGLVAELYSPTADAWSPIRPPRETGDVVSLAAVGSIGDQTFIRLDSEVYAYSMAGQVWERLPDAPAAWDRVCVARDVLVAGGSVVENVVDIDRLSPGVNGVIDTNATPDEPPVSGSTYDPSTGEWTAVSRTGDDDDAAQQFQVVCTSDGLLMVPVGPLPASGQWNVYAYANGRWTAQPPPPERLGALSASISSSDSVTFWAEAKQVTFSYGAEPTWRTVSDPRDVVAAVPIDDGKALLVQRVEQGVVATATISVVP